MAAQIVNHKIETKKFMSNKVSVKKRRDPLWERAKFPDLTMFRTKYKNEYYFALYTGGNICHNNIIGHNLASVSKAIRNVSTNIWYYWEYKLPHFDEWQPLYKRRNECI